MKRAAAFIMSMVLAAGLAGCGTEKDLSKVELTDIQEANQGEKLLENHGVVSYKMEFRDSDGKMTEEASLVKDGKDTVYQVKLSQSSTYNRTEVYKDGWSYSEFVDGEDITHEVFWYMDGEYDAELKQYVDAFLVDGVDGLEIKEREEGENYYSIKAQVDEGDNVSEEYDYFYEYVVDKSSLEIDQYVAYALDSDEKQNVMSFAEVTYDDKYSEPDFVKSLQNAEKTRTVTIITDPGTSSEKKTEVKIASTALFDAVVADGYGVYTDRDGRQQYDETSQEADQNGNYEDITLYLIK